MFGFRKKSKETAKSAEPDETRATLTSDEATWIFVGDPSKITVNAQTALNCSPVYASTKVLSETIGQLPMHLYKREGEGKERDRNHPAAIVANQFSNPWTSAIQLREQMMVDSCLHGNGYAWIGRNGKKEVKEIQRLDPNSVTPKRLPSGEPAYEVTQQTGNAIIYAFTDIIHIQDVSVDGLKAEAPIKCGKKAIQLALSLEQHALSLFQNGARPSGYIKTKRSMGEKGRTNFKNAFARAFSGQMNTGHVPVLDEDMSFESLTFNSTDAQFLELRKFAVLEIARLYRMPPHFLAELERTTHANAEQMGAQFLAYTILPWLKAWQAEFALKLLTPKERETHYFEFLVDDLVRADIAARFNAYSQAVTNGILNRNEVRSAENRAPYEGGNEFLTPMNMNGTPNEAA